MQTLTRPPIPESPPWDLVSPLEGHPLADELNVDGRLEWIDAMVRKYGFVPKGKRSPFDDVRERIVERQQESRLFLGVVGEFSSGKSTLINALVRDVILRSDVLQGTTAAATVIYHGPELSVRVRHRTKNIILRSATALVAGVKKLIGLFKEAPPPPTRDDMLSLIHRATSDEEFARDVIQVDVEMPAESLKSGLVIIDTPGANAENPRHAHVTSAAIRDLCDAALVTVPAEAAGSDSLMKFLSDHAADVVHRCIFIVTKLDLLRRKADRDRVINNLRARLSTTFDLASPRVLAAAPQFMIERMKGPAAGNNADGDGFTAEEIENWVAHFVGMEKTLHELLREKRLQAQADDVARMTTQLFDRLSEMLQKLLDDYRRRRETMERLVIPDIEGFIRDRVGHFVERATNSIKKVVMKYEAEFPGMISELESGVMSAVQNASSRSGLKSAVETDIPVLLESGQHKLQKYARKTMERITKAGQAEVQAFHDEFQQHYRSLATLDGTLSYQGTELATVGQQFGQSVQAIPADIAAGLRKVDSDRQGRALGGGAAGAAIGTFLLPGVGTLLGGAVGALFSGLFGPSLESLKADCLRQLDSNIGYELRKILRSTNAAIEKVCDGVVAEIAESISSYQPRYQSLVEQMRRRDAEEKAQLDVTQRNIGIDLQAIDNQRGSLDGFRRRIRSL